MEKQETEKLNINELLEKIEQLKQENEELKINESALQENLSSFKSKNDELKKETHDLKVENKKFLNLINLGSDKVTLSDSDLFKGFSKYDRKD